MQKKNKVQDILDFMEIHKSTKTTSQMFNYFQKNDLLDSLVYAFPFMVKGNVLAFEVLLSKDVCLKYGIDRPELFDKDIIEDMLARND
jgi:hypothetical protein